MIESSFFCARNARKTEKGYGRMDIGRPRNSSPFARAYAHIRAAVVAGDYPPGSRLMIGDVARTLQLSPTPVREALATLSGEAIVARHRDAGYFVPRPDAQEIADLYALEARCLGGRAATMRVVHVDKAGGAHVATQSVQDVRSLIEWLATCSGNSALLAAVQILNDRLSAARRAETLIWTSGEIEAVWMTSARGTVVARRAIQRHLARCIRHAHDIAMRIDR